MFLLFFNKGFVFRVELRYMPDSYTGTVRSTEPGFCGDEAPIFHMFAQSIGIEVKEQKETYTITKYSDKYIMRLTVADHITDITWDLRGGPSSANF